MDGFLYEVISVEQHLKEIAKELKLIRQELQRENEMYEEPQIQVDGEMKRPDITSQLNEMFNNES